ncbi:MAG: transglutaminase-like domain-containing protein [Planctomycetota bacterium]
MSADGLLAGRVRAGGRQRPRIVAGSAATDGAGCLQPAERGVHVLTVMLALLASVVFLTTDADGQRSDASAGFQFALESLLVLGSAWLVQRHRGWLAASPLQLPLALLVLLGSLFWEPVQRLVLETGRPFEMLVMHSQKNLMLALAVLGLTSGFRRLSVFIGLAVCIFCCALAREPRVFWLAAAWGVLCISWLMASYWSGLQGRMLPGQRTRLPRRWLLAAPALGLLTAAGTAGGGRELISAAEGFLPGSGGDGEYDEFARSGVNDGDAMVAGKDDIRSFGPLDESPFADSDKPSLYDVINDRFDEPVRKNRTFQPAVTLPPELMAEVRQRLSEVRQAGREFSLVRRQRTQERRRARSISSATMFFVAGRTPLHLRTEVYDIFDGISWHPEGPAPEALPLQLVQTAGKPWLLLPQGPRGMELFAHTDHHVLRPVNLKSPVIPGPLDLRQLHIDRVERPDMFAWHAPGVVRMTGETLPELVPIHLQSEVLDPGRLRESSLLMFSSGRETPTQSLPNDPQMHEIRRLAQAWTSELPRGMQQVDEICHRLRTEFQLNANTPVVPESDAPLTDFLSSRQGPEYLFASTAALMLRSLGYSTRLVSGFYARPERYEPRRRQTPVQGEDAHFWCELLVGPGTWITVEAAPGYDVLQPPPGLLQWLAGSCLSLLQLALRHWLVSSSALAVSGLCVVQRAYLRDAYQTCVWRFFAAADDRGRVQQTVRLVERRLALAGLRRPSHLTLKRWLVELPIENPQAVRELAELADAAAFGDLSGDSGVLVDVRRRCDWLQGQLSLRGCQQVAVRRRAAPGSSVSPSRFGRVAAFRFTFPLRSLSSG